MKLNNLTPIVLSAAALCAGSLSLSAATSGVVGATTITIPGGFNALVTPYVQPVDWQGAASGIAGQDVTVSGLTAGAYDNGLYYAEVLNDTNAGDGVDTEGLVLDVASNTATVLTLVGDTTGINGDETIAVRKHNTINELFAGATGLSDFSDNVTIYLDGALDAYTYGGGLWYDSGFAQVDNIILPPGVGFVLSNLGPVTMTVYGSVKETPTIVPVYGGNVVNVLGFADPVGPINVTTEVDLSGLAGFSDSITKYSTDGLNSLETVYVTDGTGVTYNNGTFALEDVISADTQALVFVVGSDTTIKLPGNTVAP